MLVPLNGEKPSGLRAFVCCNNRYAARLTRELFTTLPTCDQTEQGCRQDDNQTNCNHDPERLTQVDCMPAAREPLGDEYSPVDATLVKDPAFPVGRIVPLAAIGPNPLFFSGRICSRVKSTPSGHQGHVQQSYNRSNKSESRSRHRAPSEIAGGRVVSCPVEHEPTSYTANECASENELQCADYHRRELCGG